MKPPTLTTIKKVRIYTGHLDRNLLVEVPRTLAHVSGGGPGTHENILTNVRGRERKNWPVKQLLFLEDYGDDMPEEIKKRLRIEGLGVVLETASWLCYLFEVGGGILSLYPLSSLVTRDEERAPPPDLDQFLGLLNHKRPYHFEIDYFALEGFVEGEYGWSTLRAGLRVVVRAWRQYVAGRGRDDA